MIQVITTAPIYAQIIIGDPSSNMPLPILEGQNRWVAYTQHFVTVGTRGDVDGETEIVLGEISDFDLGLPIFDGFVCTPGRSIAIETAELALLLEQKVRSNLTRVKIWTAPTIEPEKVVIAIE